MRGLIFIILLCCSLKVVPREMLLFLDSNCSTRDMECDRPAQNTDPLDLLCFRCEKEHKNTTLLPCRELCVCIGV